MDRPRHLHSIRNVDEGTAALQRGREPRETALVEADRASEVPLEERRMGSCRIQDRQDQDTEVRKLVIAVDQDRVGVELDQKSRPFLLGTDLDPQRRRKLGRRRHGRMRLPRREHRVPMERADVGPAPQLLGPGRKRRLLAIGPCLGAAPGEELRLGPPLGEGRDLGLSQSADAKRIAGPRGRQSIGWIHAWFSVGWCCQSAERAVSRPTPPFGVE